MNGFDTYEQLLAAIKNRDVPVETLDRGPNGEPIVSVKLGGNREPTIAITAGAHATEHAGVRAAVELIDTLETDHTTYIVPSRDPVGLDGYERTVSSVLNEQVSFDSYDELTTVLRKRGSVVLDDDLLLVLIGDTGFATKTPEDDLPTSIALLGALKELQHARPDVIEPFRGRRIVVPGGHPDVEETGDFDRAYTLIVSPDGEVLHLNRFFDREWAPPETRGVQRLFADVKPGLVFDLHESSRQADRFHLSLRPPQSGPGRIDEKTVGRRVVSAVEEIGVPMATDADILDEGFDVLGRNDGNVVSNDQFYSKAMDGAYWVDPHTTDPPRSGEGLNAVDFAADEYGLAYTTETGMDGTFEDRVRATVEAVRAGAEAFTDRF